MIYLVAILLPWLALMVRGLVMQGVICLILQVTLIGWLPATIWAIIALNNNDAKKRHNELMEAVKKNETYSKPNDFRTVEEKARLYDEMMRSQKS